MRKKLKVILILFIYSEPSLETLISNDRFSVSNLKDEYWHVPKVLLWKLEVIYILCKKLTSCVVTSNKSVMVDYKFTSHYMSGLIKEVTPYM